VKNLAHSASFHADERIAPSNPGIRHLVITSGGANADRVSMGIIAKDTSALQRLAVANVRRLLPDETRPPTSTRVRAPRIVLARMLLRPARKRAPWTAAFSIIPSSTSTRRAARATAQAIGLPPNVEPCWPGFRVPSTALFERTADDAGGVPKYVLARQPYWQG
jgi:hypothetical protein